MDSGETGLAPSFLSTRFYCVWQSCNSCKRSSNSRICFIRTTVRVTSSYWTGETNYVLDQQNKLPFIGTQHGRSSKERFALAPPSAW